MSSHVDLTVSGSMTGEGTSTNLRILQIGVLIFQGEEAFLVAFTDRSVEIKEFHLKHSISFIKRSKRGKDCP